MIEINITTGEITEREMTQEEIAQLEAMKSEKVDIEPRPTLEEKVAELQQVIVELTTVLNDKGIVS